MLPLSSKIPARGTRKSRPLRIDKGVRPNYVLCASRPGRGTHVYPEIRRNERRERRRAVLVLAMPAPAQFHVLLPLTTLSSFFSILYNAAVLVLRFYLKSK